ncbi:hypothetical protein SETIT_7G039300v2 [Setaria italica]|uniref:Uncharacterized protein n=1 Tax=Setaria italica TaxID=4555 RepID=A0A368RRY5_SETIT|nr:hypothetical protein SETIT_7G039300v2 [Setaria italica]
MLLALLSRHPTTAAASSRRRPVTPCTTASLGGGNRREPAVSSFLFACAGGRTQGVGAEHSMALQQDR